MTTEKRDYSKLRPFDLEAAKHGDGFVGWKDLQPRKLVAGPDKSGWLIVEDDDGGYGFGMPTDYRLAPLAWVRKSADEDVLWPVYKGDVLWHPIKGKYTVDMLMSAPGKVIALHESGFFSFLNPPDVDELTFTPPKVKREVKLLAYLDADQLFWLRETAQPKWPAVRVPLEDRVVEVEEPAGQEGGAQ